MSRFYKLWIIVCLAILIAFFWASRWQPLEDGPANPFSAYRVWEAEVTIERSFDLFYERPAAGTRITGLDELTIYLFLSQRDMGSPYLAWMGGDIRGADWSSLHHDITMWNSPDSDERVETRLTVSGSGYSNAFIYLEIDPQYHRYRFYYHTGMLDVQSKGQTTVWKAGQTSVKPESFPGIRYFSHTSRWFPLPLTTTELRGSSNERAQTGRHQFNWVIRPLS